MDPAAVRSAAGHLRLRLYIVGGAPNSVRALANIKSICAEDFEGSELEVIDVLEHPERALVDRVIVTPTLVRTHPTPKERVIGNLDDTRQVLLTLGRK